MSSRNLKRRDRDADSLSDIPVETGQPKKQKLGPSVSFANVLADMGKEEAEAGTGAQSWTRPSVKTETINGPIIFQYLDIEESVTPDGEATIRLFGCTKEGYSVLANVTGFLHYLYFPVPAGFKKSDIKPLTDHLNGLLPDPVVETIDMVRKRLTESRNPTDFLKISVSNPRMLSRLQDELHCILERGRCQYKGLFDTPEKTYEGSVNYTLRFMIDMEIPGMSWIKVPVGKYSLSTRKVSNCQIEFQVSYDDIEPLPVDSKWSEIAPLRILSFDIEAQPLGVQFPQPGRDSVLQIANVVTYHGADKPFLRTIFTLSSCLPIEGSEVFSYDTEEEMLMAWKDFVIKVDPDVMTGYNIGRFDIPYLLLRAKKLQLDKFLFLGRLRDSPSKVARMITDWPDVPMLPGRVSLDIFHYITTNYEFPPVSGARTLGAVSSRFLGQNKEDIHFTMIAELQNGTSESRQRLAIYCAKDAYLPQLLMDKLECLEKRTEKARLEYVPINSLLNQEGLVEKSKSLRNALRDSRVLIV